MEIKTYLINLEKDVERFRAMDQRLSAAEIPYERFPALTADNLPNWLKPYLLDRLGNKPIELSDGEIGCYASHLSVMMKCLEDGETVLVLEDDLQFPPNFKSLIKLCLNFQTPWDMLRLSSSDKRPVISLGELTPEYQVVEYLRVPPNLGAYLVRPVGAQKFLSWSQPRWRPVDQDLRRPWENDVHTIGIFPRPVLPNQFPSSIDSIGPRRRGRAKYSRDSRNGDKLRGLLYNFRRIGVSRTLRALAARAVHF
ncbi:MAG: glycosyltransferase family 25 protein [Hyphomicrobium sp.]|nr:glycosyltransferase family 25 protein [Hyphomicrobium sp.]